MNQNLEKLLRIKEKIGNLFGSKNPGTLVVDSVKSKKALLSDGLSQLGTKISTLLNIRSEKEEWMPYDMSEPKFEFKNVEESKNTRMSKDFIWVTFQKEGIHKYPAALEDPKLADVSFLGHPHRHMFHFRVELEVMHDDRDVEFILFKRELEALYDEGTMQLDYKSCEMMARELAKYVIENYPDRDVAIEVSEDGENGCRLSFPYV